jgi:hypothetical protein
MTFAGAQASDSLYVWYGNLDGSPLESGTGALLEIEVYAKTTSGAYIASLLLNLGADDDYFDSLLSEESGEIYYPLTEWDLAMFFPPDQAPPNPEGWKSQALFGLADLAPPYNSYWLHFDDPTLIFKYVFKTSSNSDIIGQTAACLGPGLNTPQGPSNAGDTAGNANYYVAEFFSPVHFEGPTDLNETNLELPTKTEISQNYPNPFNASTNIEYTLASASKVTLTVYDVQGRVVDKLVDSYQQAGFYRVNWNGDYLPSGVYFYKLNTGDLSEVKQMVLMK